MSLTHINYKSGFIHDMSRITDAAHAKGALIVWDLSHSAGIMPLALNEADADFAVGCGYKFLNGGPGAPAYVFVAERNQHEFEHPLTGWLGHKDPFAFAPEFIPARGMDKLLTGTPPILSLITLDAALDAFDGVDMNAVRVKTKSLSQLFVDLVDHRLTVVSSNPAGVLAPVARRSDGEESRFRSGENVLGAEPDFATQRPERPGPLLVVCEIGDVLPQHESEGIGRRGLGRGSVELLEAFHAAGELAGQGTSQPVMRRV